MNQSDVTEASKKVASQVVEAAIVETEARFALDSRVLKQLADAGVPPSVIDLMVAQSFPDHFRVERPVTFAPQTTVMTGTAQYPSYPLDPYGTFGAYGMYDPYAYYSYYYSPFAYPYYWGSSYSRGPVYYITNGNTVIVPNGSGTTATTSSEGPGQVVNGRGYTRVHTASPGDSDAAQQQQAGPTGQRTVTAPRGARTTSSSGSDASSGSSGSNSAADRPLPFVCRLPLVFIGFSIYHRSAVGSKKPEPFSLTAHCPLPTAHSFRNYVKRNAD